MNSVMRSLRQKAGWLLMIAVVGGLGDPAFALTPEEIRAEIRSQMALRHPGDSGPFWDRLGPESVPVLRQMYQESTSSHERSWLIDGLSRFNDPGVGELLRSEVEKTENAVMKKKLLSAYVQSQGDAALGFVEPYLSSPDPHIRKALFRAIGAHVSRGKSEAVLARFRANEKEAWVLEAGVEGTDRSEGGLRKRPPQGVVRPGSDVEKSARPGSRQDLEGEWSGLMIGPKRSVPAKVRLQWKNGKWSVELSRPRIAKMVFDLPEAELIHFSTAKDHWVEIRRSAEDAVFLARKPGSK